MTLKENDFKMIRRFCWKLFLAHPNWKAAFNSIIQEDNFYRRRGLIDLLETYSNQEKVLQYHGTICDSYLNIIYGSLKRLKFFWPYLSNKNPMIEKYENTPFHFVTFHGLSDVANFMIEELSVEDCLTKDGYYGYTPLHTMVRRGHAEIIRSLRRKIDFEGKLIIPKLFEEVLQCAIGHGNLDCIMALLEKQTSYFQRNADGIARNYYSQTKNQNHYKIAKYLSKEFGLSVLPISISY